MTTFATPAALPGTGVAYQAPGTAPARPGYRGDMTTTLRQPLTLALLLSLFGAAAALEPWPVRAQDAEAAAGSADVIFLVGGKRRTGEILEEHAMRVKIKASDQTQTLKREEIARVEYRDAPPQLKEAERALAKGDAEAAVKALRDGLAAVEAGKHRPLHKPHVLLALGRALLAAQKFAEAGESFVACAETAPSGPSIREAVREGVRAFIRAAEYRKAREFAEKSKEKLKSAELPEEAQDEANLLRAEALEAEGKVDEARQVYNLLTNSRDGRVRGRASLGAARGALQSKDFSRAESKFREILADKDAERSVKCGAARGLGDVILAQPGAKKDYVKLRMAADAYARALAVEFPARDEPTVDREAALAAGADVYDALAALAQGDKEAKARELYAALAQQYREELLRLYKTSALRADVEAKLKSGEGTKQ